jgi:hypothetical protein
MISSEKKWIVMNPIRCRMKKLSLSSGQNDQLVHWWLLVHSGPIIPTFHDCLYYVSTSLYYKVYYALQL